jgi:hypothetical protein
MSLFRLRGLPARLVAIACAVTVGAVAFPSAAAESGADPRDTRVAVASPAQAAAAPLPAPPAGAPTGAAPEGPGRSATVRSTVTMATGHRVRLDSTQDRPPSVTILPTNPKDAKKPEQSAFTQLQLGGDTYVVPNVAIPYLSTLDIRLFNVSYLARAELDDEHSQSLPVSITYRQPQATALPGVRAAAPAGRKASAGIAKGQARQLGQLLVNQWQKAESGRSATPAGQLEGITRIELVQSGKEKLPPAPAMLSPTPTPTPAKATGSSGPAYHTVTINPITKDGTSGHAVGFVQHVDDVRLSPSGTDYGMFIIGDGYPTTFSMAEGTYSVTATVVDGPVGDYSVPSAFVAEPEVAVSSDTTIDLDSRDAVPFETTLEAPLETPEYRQDMLTFTRTSVGGGDRRVQASFGGVISMIFMRMWSFPGDGDANEILSATPTEPVTKGEFGFAAITQFAQDQNDTVAAPRPSYKLVFPTDGRIPDSLTYSVGAEDLTTVRTELYGTTPMPNHVVEHYLPWSTNTLGVGQPNLRPGEYIDYWYSSDPELSVWQDFVTREEVSSPEPQYIRIYGPRRTIRPGEVIDEEWHKGPLVPSARAPYLYWPMMTVDPFTGEAGDIAAADPAAMLCTACRQDDNGMVYIEPFADSDPAHTGRNEDTITSTVRFHRNGKLAFDSGPTTGGSDYVVPHGLDLPLLPTAATYQLDWKTTEFRDPAISTTTKWRFLSGPEDRAVELPEDTYCGPDTSQGCSLLPLLFVNYDLDLTNALSAAAGSPFELAFGVGGQQAAPTPTGVSATVSVSFDDGVTWTDPRAATSHGNGKFTLPIQHPPLGETSGHVSLRVHAKDAVGNSVEQELIHAYALHG